MSLGDALIAATALEHGLTLMTRNVRVSPRFRDLCSPRHSRATSAFHQAPTAVRVSNARSSSSGKRPSP